MYKVTLDGSINPYTHLIKPDSIILYQEILVNIVVYGDTVHPFFVI
jgi:hypothetical protein